ncbi:MAG: hypothetical protein P1P82_16700 [Bacteroidales bacterium]|nr:hypothetical protein [Bacteroidales bacterium]MDT8432910.1 hypothetical protein [Bacteroidales bacterium]
MKKLLILCAVMLIAIPALSQNRPKFLYAEFADQSINVWPLFGYHFDPAITVGGGIDYWGRRNLTIFQTAQLTRYKTPLFGNGLILTTSAGCRYAHSSGLFGEGMVGIGTTAFFSSRQTFMQDEAGDYKPANPLRINAAAPALDVHLGYAKGSYAFYLQFRCMGVFPYTGRFMIWPVSQLGIGLRYNLHATEN